MKREVVEEGRLDNLKVGWQRPRLTKIDSNGPLRP